MAAHEPGSVIYDGTRKFLGRLDLVVSFFTLKCQFGCAFCTLPERSSKEQVTVRDLNYQFDSVIHKYRSKLSHFEQFSFGNEGSVLDPRRFHTESLHYLLERLSNFKKLEVLSIETRPEYIRTRNLADIRSRISTPVMLDLTLGFETQDDKIRIDLLRKKITKKMFEDRLTLMADFGARLTSYVMLKPVPGMSEEQGVEEAVRTLDYLQEQTSRRGMRLIVYLNPTYVAQGSKFTQSDTPGSYRPPSLWSVLEVLKAARDRAVSTYVGLWSEGLAARNGDYNSQDGYNESLRAAIIEQNTTASFAGLAAFIDRTSDNG